MAFHPALQRHPFDAGHVQMLNFQFLSPPTEKLELFRLGHLLMASVCVSPITFVLKVMEPLLFLWIFPVEIPSPEDLSKRCVTVTST